MSENLQEGNEMVNETKEETMAGGFAARHNLTRVTSLSKYLALTLFILLPFLGGYIGYVYAPEKAEEVEGTVPVEEYENTIVDLTDNNGYVFVASQKRGGSDNHWLGGYLYVLSSDLKQVVDKGLLTKPDEYMSGVYMFGTAIYSVSRSGVYKYDPKQHVSKLIYSSDKVGDIYPTDDGILIREFDDPTCVDSPTKDCVGAVALLKNYNNLVTLAHSAPGEMIVSYVGNSKIWLEEGYGDAGCVDNQFYLYDMNTATSTIDESFETCVGLDDGAEVMQQYNQSLSAYLESVGSAIAYWPDRIYAAKVADGQFISVDYSMTDVQSVVDGLVWKLHLSKRSEEMSDDVMLESRDVSLFSFVINGGEQNIESSWPLYATSTVYLSDGEEYFKLHEANEHCSLISEENLTNVLSDTNARKDILSSYVKSVDNVYAGVSCWVAGSGYEMYLIKDNIGVARVLGFTVSELSAEARAANISPFGKMVVLYPQQ